MDICWWGFKGVCLGTERLGCYRKFSAIANHVTIISGGDHGHKMNVSNYPFRVKMLNLACEINLNCKGPVIIGNDVWIGSHAIILSGVCVGDGAVVGAGGCCY